MKILYIDGHRVELASADLDCGFQFVSAVEGLDKRHASRTTSIKIPLTPANNLLLGLAGHVEMFAPAVRQGHTAELIYDGGVVRGMFKVTGVTPKEVTGTMIFGENYPFTDERFTAEIGKILTSSEHITLRTQGYYVENSRNLSSPRMGLKGFGAPSVKVDYLLGLLEGQLGTDLTAYKGTDCRILLGTLNAHTQPYSGTLQLTNSGTWNAPADWSTYFSEQTVTIRHKVTRVGVGNTEVLVTVKMWRCIRPCSVSLTGSNPHGYATLNGITPVSWWGWAVIDKAFKPASDVEEVIQQIKAASIMQTTSLQHDFEVGEWLGALRKAERLTMNVGGNIYYYPKALAMVSEFGQQLIATASFGEVGDTLTRSQDSTSYLYGEYYLADNFPKISAKDLLQTLARVQGGEAMFDEAGGRFTIFDYDFDGSGSGVTSLDGNCEIVSITREALGYGRTHTQTLKVEKGDGWAYSPQDLTKAMARYETPNSNLTEATKADLKLSASPSASVPDDVQPYPNLGGLPAFVPVSGVDSDGKPVFNTFDSPVLVKGGSRYPGAPSEWVTPVQVATNAKLVTICNLSTACEVKTPMPLCRFMQITTYSRFTLAGGWWFAREATWQAGFAKIKLQRYK